MSQALAADELARLQAFHCHGILDTPPEKEFDDIALPASRICGTSIVRRRMAREGVMILQKPFTPTALAQKVRAALDRPPAHEDHSPDR